MTDLELLSRLAAGELDPADARALRARLEVDPVLRRAWAQLQALDADFDALFSVEPPPSLGGGVEAPQQEQGGVPWGLGTAIGLAAAVALFAWPTHDPPQLLLADGTELVRGHQQVVVGELSIEVDGVAEISVEPTGRLPRATARGGDAMGRFEQVKAATVGAVVTVLVYEGVAIVRPAAGSESTVTAGEQLTIGEPGPAHPAPVAIPLPRTVDEQGRIDELEAENALLHKLLDDMRTEFLGTAAPWTDDIAEYLRPEAFRANVEAAIEQCEAGVELVDFECSEPPCFALLRPQSDDWWDDLVNDCGPWTDNYTNAVSSASFNARCRDGTEERVQMLGWSTHLLPELSEEDRANRSKRFMARIDEVKLGWRCEGE